jgi:hypothetical protein
MNIINSLPKDAKQIANLICINETSQKFYQIYRVESKKLNITKDIRYDVITGHGRIGHSAKYLMLISNASMSVANELVEQTLKNKINKGYQNEALNKDPMSFLKNGPSKVSVKKANIALAKIQSKKINTKLFKGKVKYPLVMIVPDMDSPVEEVEEEPAKKKAPSYNRLSFLG